MKQLHSESQRLVRGQFARNTFIIFLYFLLSKPQIFIIFFNHSIKCMDAASLTHSTVFVESTLGLPYHIPEPKTIDQFFKKRARPEGPAMALLK